MDDGGVVEVDGDPDVYKDDWHSSIVFKKAMKAEAIKRGEPYGSEFEVDDDEDKIAMTVSGTMRSKPKSD